MIDINTLPHLAFESMNQVHAQEVERLNNLYTLLDTAILDAECIDEALVEIVAHTREHFAGEEKLMKQVSFPTYNIHKAEHGRVLNEMQYVIMDWNNRKDYERLNEYFKEEIPAWLHQHVSSMDVPAAEFIALRS